jgi:hypothetical protein
MIRHYITGIFLLAMIAAFGAKVFAEDGDALFIDEDGTVNVKRLDVEGTANVKQLDVQSVVTSRDLKASGTVDAKKYIGDGSDLKIKTKLGESSLKSIFEDPVPVGSFHWDGWIVELGQYGSAEIDVKPGDIVKVDLIGSAEQSEFYYNIVETTGDAEVIAAPPQVIMNPYRWRSITTTGLFKAKETEANSGTALKFSANFTKGGVSGKVKVAGLTMIATVVGREKLISTVIRNLARQEGATAEQSSTYGDGVAERAIDGNIDGNYNNRSVAHTENKDNSWWQVKLPKPAKIKNIVIWNRTDCCGNRLSNFDVSILDDSPNPLWQFHYDGPAGHFVSIPVKPDIQAAGVFVKIQIRGKNKDRNGHLSLAEVQVFGEFTK